jgi:pimeloyl-ACP methyl ester carboxylesterase
VIAEHPERIARIVLTNCDTFENFPPPILAPVYRAARLPGFFWLCGQLLRSPIAQRAFYRTVAHRVPAPDVLAAMLRPLRANAGVRADLAAFIASITSRELIDIAPRLAAFAGPALIVWGDDDWFFPMRDARRLAGAFRAATLVTVAGSRTFVSEDAPMVLAESIERFLAAAVPA